MEGAFYLAFIPTGVELKDASKPLAAIVNLGGDAARTSPGDKCPHWRVVGTANFGPLDTAGIPPRINHHISASEAAAVAPGDQSLMGKRADTQLTRVVENVARIEAHRAIPESGDDVFVIPKEQNLMVVCFRGRPHLDPEFVVIDYV